MALTSFILLRAVKNREKQLKHEEKLRSQASTPQPTEKVTDSIQSEKDVDAEKGQIIHKVWMELFVLILE